jgi:DNA-binding GntR family transcriptional regulator
MGSSIVFDMTQKTADRPAEFGSAGRAYELIRAAIIDGRYQPSQRLIEQRIGDEFSLSRTPVREALRLLEAEGMVITERNRGAIVRPVTREDVADLYELRTRLESLAAERAATRATPEDIAELDASIAAFDHEIRPSDTAEVAEIQALNQANIWFHATIVRIADHSRLRQLLGRAVDIPLVFQAFRVFTHQDRVRANLFHQLIREAVARNEPDRAGRLMSEHILLGRDALLASLPEAPPLQRSSVAELL